MSLFVFSTDVIICVRARLPQLLSRPLCTLPSAVRQRSPSSSHAAHVLRRSSNLDCRRFRKALVQDSENSCAPRNRCRCIPLIAQRQLEQWYCKRMHGSASSLEHYIIAYASCHTLSVHRKQADGVFAVVPGVFSAKPPCVTPFATIQERANTHFTRSRSSMVSYLSCAHWLCPPHLTTC